MIKLPPVIGLCGPQGAGKDTVALAIRERLRQTHTVEVISFAGPIRDMLAALLAHLDIDRAVMEDRATKEVCLPELARSPRELTRTLGTEWGRREVHPDLWVLIAKHRLGRNREAGRLTVVTDVRFENEAHFIRKSGGRVIEIRRPGDYYYGGHHASDRPLPAELIHRSVLNDGTPAELAEHILAGSPA